MKKVILIIIGILSCMASFYIGWNSWDHFNPCNLEHSEIDEQEIMVEQFHEYQLNHIIKLQNQSID